MLIKTQNLSARFTKSCILLFVAFAVRSPFAFSQYFTRTYGDIFVSSPPLITTVYEDHCEAGLTTSSGDIVSVGWNNDPDPNFYFLSTNSSGTPITNGSFHLYLWGGSAPDYLTIQANDVVEVDNNLFAVVGSVSESNLTSYTNIFVMIVDITGSIKCIYTYDIPGNVTGEIGNAITVSNNVGVSGFRDLFITGGAISGSSEKIVVASLSLSYNISSGYTIAKNWGKTFDIIKRSGNSCSPGTYDQEGCDILFNPTNNLLYVTGRCVFTGYPLMSGYGLLMEIDPITGASTTSNFNFLHAPSGYNMNYSALKFDVGSGNLFIGGTLLQGPGIYDVLLTSIDLTGTWQFTKRYTTSPSFSVPRDDRFRSLLLSNTSPPNCYMLGSTSSSATDILLLKTDLAGLPIADRAFGNSNSDIGNDISEDVSGTSLNIHATSNSYSTPANYDFELTKVNYNCFTNCDYTSPDIMYEDMPDGIELVEFENVDVLDVDSLTYDFRYGIENTICHGSAESIVESTEKNVIGKKILFKCYPTVLAEDNIINIEMNVTTKNSTCQIELLDNIGRMITTITTKPSEKIEIKLKDYLAQGIYSLKINCNGSTQVFKLLK